MNLRAGVTESSAGKNQRVFVKGMILFAALFLVFLMIAFGRIVYSDGVCNIKLDFFDLVTSLFCGGSVRYNLYGTIVEIHIPAYLTAFYLTAAFFAVSSAALILIMQVILKKDPVFTGWYQIAGGLFIILSYVLLLTCGRFSCTDYSRKEHVFYTLYEISAIYLFSGAVMALAGIIQIRCKISIIDRVRKYFVIYPLLIIPVAAIMIFSVYPILIQIILSFKEYTLRDGIWGSAWIGLENFKTLFTDPQMLLVMWQTVYLSFLRLLAGVLPSVILALVLYHITSGWYGSLIQTVIYIPHFFSWVVIYAIVSSFLTPGGVVNSMASKWFGAESVDYLSREDLFYFNMIWTSVWKEAGWGTILYMAALMSIDRTLYDAAAIDGAGVFKKLSAITLPGMVPILVFQVIMAVGNILRGAGGEQILLFATSSVKNGKALVIDTWLYWYGLNELKYGLAGAVSFVQSAIGFLMVLGAHNLSKKTVGIGAW